VAEALAFSFDAIGYMILDGVELVNDGKLYEN
jgi:hypothetical protein